MSDTNLKGDNPRPSTIQTKFGLIRGLMLWWLTPLQQYLSYIVVVGFIGGVPRENHWPASRPWQTLSHQFASSTPRHEWYSNS